MKAAIYPAYGPPESLVMADIATPTPKDGEALVRVNYAGINPIDWKIGEGRLKAYIDCSFPLVVGRDISGVISDTNSNGQFAMGDKVVAALPGPGCGLAEYVAVPVDYLALAPHKTSLKESASIPLVGLTCWQGLIEFAELSKGQVIFILSGAGGTGSFAIQLAKSVGATVVTTCRSAKNPTTLSSSSCTKRFVRSSMILRQPRRCVRPIIPSAPNDCASPTTISPHTTSHT